MAPEAPSSSNSFQSLETRSSLKPMNSCFGLRRTQRSSRKSKDKRFGNFTTSTKSSEGDNDIEEEELVFNQSRVREHFYTCEDLDFLHTHSSAGSTHSHDSPVILKFDENDVKSGKQKLLGLSRGSQNQLPFNEPAVSSVFSFDSELFSGKALFRLKHCGNCSEDYFKGRRRKQQFVVQGSFKRSISVGEVFGGYELNKPAKHVPGKFIVRTVLQLIKQIAPTLREDVFAKKPFVYNPLLQTVQTLDVSSPGEEPHICAREFEENNELLFENCSSKKKLKSRSAKERKKYFASSSNGAKHKFVPGYVYTFEFYEDKVDVSTFKLILPFMSFDLKKHLDGEPIPFMAKILSADRELHEKYVFRFLLFHKEQLQHQNENSHEIDLS